MTARLLIGDRLSPPGKRELYLEVLDLRLHDGCIKVFDVERREDRYLELKTLLADIHQGRLTVVRQGAPLFSHAEQADDEALYEQSRFIQEVMYRIKDIRKRRNVSFRGAYRLLSEACEANPALLSKPLPSLARMYNYRNSCLAGLPVLRGDKNKGNRVARYPAEVVKVIYVLAEQHYLLPQSRWSLERLTMEVNRQVHGIHVPATAPCITSKFVKKTIESNLCVDIEAARMLPTEVGSAKSIAKQRIQVEGLLERVEQDALHLPFVAKTASGESSVVYLVHAIDCGASFPLAWWLTVGQPIEADTLRCVERFMFPLKAELIKAFGIDLDLDVFGTPSLLLFDNGSENKGGRIKNLEKLGIDVQHCRARSGQDKPFIERFNRSLKTALEALPGCTRMDGKDGVRDPIALGDALMTLEELEAWIVRWYYESWIHKPLERLQSGAVLESMLEGNTPYERVKYFQDIGMPIPLPPSRTEWLHALYEHTEAKLNRKTGITVNGLNYKGEAIVALLARHGEQHLHVLYNPDDFRFVYVYEGDDLPLVTLEYEHLRPETPAWTVLEFKERLKLQKAKSTPAPQSVKFEQDLHEKVVSASLAPKVKPSKPRSKYERNREVTQSEKDARAAQRAAKQPGPRPPPVVTKGSQGLSATDTPSSFSQLLDDAPLLQVLDRDTGGVR